MYLDDGITWKFQTEQIKSKLGMSCGLLAKLRYYIKPDLLRKLYFAIFDLIMRYDLQVWGQSKNPTFKKILKTSKQSCKNHVF